MDPSHRVRIGLALHALGGAFLLVRDEASFATLALALGVSTALLVEGALQRVAAVGAGLLLAALMMFVSLRTLADFGHVLLLLTLAVPACINAAGTSFREGRTRWLWLRALLLLLAVVTTLGVWPAPHPSVLAPVLVVSHVLLRLGTAPLERAPPSGRAVFFMAAASLALMALSQLVARDDVNLYDMPSTFDALALRGVSSPGGVSSGGLLAWIPHAPYATLAMALAFVAASVRIAPRGGVDGAIAAGIALAFAFHLEPSAWWTAYVMLAIVACFIAAATARRHLGLRAFAALTVVAAVGISEQNASELFTGALAVSIAFVAIAALVTARPSAPRVLPVDPTYARMGALLHMATLCLTVFMPTASLAALVPAVVFATKPLARFGTLALVTLAWASAPLVADALRVRNESEVALLAWAPWIMLALLDAIRTRGHPVLVARLGATVGAMLFAIAAINEGSTPTLAILPGAVVVQAVLERAVGTLRPFPRVEVLAVVVAVPVLAGLTVFEFVMRWLVSKDGFYPYWDLHPITLFLIDGTLALVCLWLVAQAGLRRALPFLAPGGAMLAAVGVVLYAKQAGHTHELAALAVAMFCAGAVTRPPIARFAGVWCGVLAALVVTLRGQLPRPDFIAELGYPLWVIVWFGALVVALVLSDAMRAAPLVTTATERAREPIMQPPV